MLSVSSSRPAGCHAACRGALSPLPPPPTMMRSSASARPMIPQPTPMTIRKMSKALAVHDKCLEKGEWEEERRSNEEGTAAISLSTAHEGDARTPKEEHDKFCYSRGDNYQSNTSNVTNRQCLVYWRLLVNSRYLVKTRIGCGDTLVVQPRQVW